MMKSDTAGDWDWAYVFDGGFVRLSIVLIGMGILLVCASNPPKDAESEIVASYMTKSERVPYPVGTDGRSLLAKDGEGSIGSSSCGTV
jgi:hypothetical protein